MSPDVVACAKAGEISISTPQNRLENGINTAEAADYTHPVPSCKCNPRNSLAADMGALFQFRKLDQSVSFPAIMAPKKPSRSRIKNPRLQAKKPAKTASPDVLERIAAALERLAPPPVETVSLTGADAFVWQAETERLMPVAAVNRVPLRLLKGIEHQSALLLANTQQHADGFPANNALLWGARGTGKSSLVKAVHAEINAKRAGATRLALVEIHREDIDSLPRLLARLRATRRQCRW